MCSKMVVAKRSAVGTVSRANGDGTDEQRWRRTPHKPIHTGLKASCGALESGDAMIRVISIAETTRRGTGDRNPQMNPTKWRAVI